MLLVWIAVVTGLVAQVASPALQTQASKTAVYVAIARAIGAKNPDVELRNPDDFAIKFLGPRERALLPDYATDALDLVRRRDGTTNLPPPPTSLSGVEGGRCIARAPDKKQP